MKKREWISLIILAMTVMPAVLIGIGQVYLTGVDGDRLKRTETLWLLFETAVLFFAAVLVLCRAKTNRLRVGLLALIASGFLWLHQAFTPVVVSGLYLAVIIKCGSGIRKLFEGKSPFPEYFLVSRKGEAAVCGRTLMADFTLGSGTMILLFCLMSLAGVGSIPWTRIGAGIFLAAVLLVERKGKKSGAKERSQAAENPGLTEEKCSAGRRRLFWTSKRNLALSTAIFTAFIFAMLLLQAGRMNICADYDSLHYGLRSEYILNDGDGIYENMGSINVVYTYSKGLETLLLPISGLPSYSFFLSFQLWMTLGILFAASEIVKLFAGRRSGLLCMVLLAAIPGITNMGITAKTDSATAFFQLIMIYFLLLYIRRQKTNLLVLAGDAFFMTMVLKPTALVFSTVLAGTAFVCMAVMRRFKISFKEPFFLSWIPMILMWGLVWLRTWLLTGLPVTSVFYSIWQKLGFAARYPFHFDSLPSNGGALFSLSGLKHLLKRIHGVLLAPVGEDMAHVRIAWGTPLILVFLVMLLLPLLADMKKNGRKEKNSLLCLVFMFLTNGAVSLAALYLLWQVDGNYFILLYALAAILAVIVIGKLENPFLKHAVIKLLIPVILFNVSVTAVSNWKGTLGLSPWKLCHAGYYDHWAAEKERMEHAGNEGIWDILAEDPENRVVVFGEQPEMLMFPCNTQSYTDIEGSGGNFYISASPEAMVSFFDYAGVDYVYLGSGYLKPGSEGWRNVTAMIERGYITDLIYENGNGLGRFVKEPETSEQAAEALAEFGEKYWPGEQQ